MTTAARNIQRAIGSGGYLGTHPVVASDIIYEGSAVGIVKASGHARPLTLPDRFAGFAKEKANNSAGAAADIDVEVIRKGVVTLTIAGVVITDVEQPVYATDDNTFTMSPVSTADVSAVYIGDVIRWDSSGKADVAFDLDTKRDPWGLGPRIDAEGDITLTIAHTGVTIFQGTDAKAITMSATVIPIKCRIVNMGAYGTVAVNVAPDANDKIRGPAKAGTNDKDHVNTKATAQRGDYIDIHNSGDADGSVLSDEVGIWVTQG